MQVDFYQIGWMVVGAGLVITFILFGISTILQQVARLYELALHGAKESAIREYAEGIRRTSYWFSARDKALVEALAEDMAEGNLYPRMDNVRDKHLPKFLNSFTPYKES